MMELKLEPIAKDDRGESWCILFPDNREAILIFTRKDYLRGGHSHNIPEISFLLSGKIRYYKMFDGKETVTELSAGQSNFNKAGEIHMALALEDYWLLDWRFNAKIGEVITTDYEPYRVRVREQLKKRGKLI